MLCSTVKSKVFDTWGIKNFIVGSKRPTRDISKKALPEKTGVASTRKSCYNFVEDHHINRSANRKIDPLLGVIYGVYAKASLRLLEIKITHSRNVEVCCRMSLVDEEEK